MLNVRLRGVMTMARYSENPEDSRDTFARAREIFFEIQDAKIAEEHCNILSMGMSGDFEVAIQEGSNLVRVGSAIFGDAPKETDEDRPESPEPDEDDEAGEVAGDDEK